MNLGMTEILLVLGIALLFFGPSRLPGLGKSLGEAIRGFKKAMDEDPSKSEKLSDKSSVNAEAPQTQKSKEHDKA